LPFFPTWPLRASGARDRRLPSPRASRLTALLVPSPSRSDGFGDTATLEGDPAAASAHLKAMTSKMAESKRLIKEYERVSKETEGADLDAVAVRKKEMVQKLNTYVNKKKAAQADIAARVASNAAAVGVPGAATAATVAGAAGTASLLAARVGTDLPSAPIDDPSAAALFKGASSALKGKASVDSGAAPEQVDLQVMELQDVMQVGRDKMKATDDAIERSKKTVETTIALGQQTAEALRNQTQQMERVVDDLDEIHFSLKKSFKVIRDLTRGLATDKCILALLFLVVAGVVAIIAVKIAGLDKNDEVIDVDPLNNQNTGDSAARRLHRRMLFDDGEARDTRTGLFLY
jgi:SNARE protein